jgi:hypothetical protein
MQCACAILSPVTYLALQKSFHLFLINGKIFGKTFLTIKCGFFIFSTNSSEIFVIVTRIQRDMIKNVERSSCKVHVILVRFYGLMESET